MLAVMMFQIRPKWLQAQTNPLAWEVHYSNADMVSSAGVSGRVFRCDILAAMDAQTNIYIQGKVPLWYDTSDGKQYPRLHKSVKLGINKLFSQTTYGITYGPLQNKMITDHVYDFGAISVGTSTKHDAIFVTKSGPNGWSITIEPPKSQYTYMKVNPIKLVMNRAGEIYVAGGCGYTSLTQGFLVWLRGTDGSMIWSNFDLSCGRPNDLDLDNTGNIYVTGTLGTIKVNPNGTSVIFKAFEADTSISNREGKSVTVDAQGNYCVAIDKTRKYRSSLPNEAGKYYYYYEPTIEIYNSANQKIWIDNLVGSWTDVYAGPVISDGLGDFYYSGREHIIDYYSNGTSTDRGMWGLLSVFTTKNNTGTSCGRKCYQGAPEDMAGDASNSIYLVNNDDYISGSSYYKYRWFLVKRNLLTSSIYQTDMATADGEMAIAIHLDANSNLYVISCDYTGSEPSKEIRVRKYTQLPDSDADGIEDAKDNCRDIKNPLQEDRDRDGVGDACDNCPDKANPDQADADQDGKGNTCDNCPNNPNADQKDSDGDGVGDVCDNCPSAANADQADADHDGLGDPCDPDIDGDTRLNNQDNCPFVANVRQEDMDHDGIGDACDPDVDGDGIPNNKDNCPLFANPAQQDSDGDGIGDFCDNCPSVANPDQKDSDHDGWGDVCIKPELTVKRVEITQAIQDEANSVPLVRGKETFIRIYLDTGPIDYSLGPVTGRARFITKDLRPVWIYKNGMLDPKSCGGGFLLSADNSIYVPPRSKFDPLYKNSTLNFTIPASWTFQEMPYIDFNIYYKTATGQTIFAYTGLHLLDYHDVPPLNIMFVPIYGGPTSDFTSWFPCHPPGENDFLMVTEWLKKIYPVSKVQLWKTPSYYIYWDPQTFINEPTSNLASGVKLIQDLWLLKTLSIIKPAPNMKYFGLLCKELDPCHKFLMCFQSGMGWDWGGVAWSVRDGYNVSTYYGGETVAHEIGHTFLGNGGFGKFYQKWPAHVKSGCDEPGPWFEDYPATSPYRGLIDANGFDGDFVYDKNLYYDVMTYAPCDASPGWGQWISTYTYKRLFNAMTNSQSALVKNTSQNERDYLVISGLIDQFYSVTDLKARHLVLPDLGDDTPHEGSYSIELENVNTGVLFRRYFESGAEESGSRTVPIVSFQEIVPYFSNTSHIFVKHGDVTIGVMTVSMNKPQVSVIYPDGGESLAGLENITWSAADGDGDALSYDLLYSMDGGSSWQAIALGITANHYLWDTEQLGGSTRGRIKVIASDGFNATEDVSDNDFIIREKGPAVSIISPGNDAKFFNGRRIIFEGGGYDNEDGPLPDDALSWTSSRDGDLGKGETVSADSLSPGSHVITLSGKDSDGNSAVASISIQVSTVMDSDGDGIGDDQDLEPLIDNSEPSAPPIGNPESPVTPPAPDQKVHIGLFKNSLPAGQIDTIYVQVENAADLAGFEFSLFFGKNNLQIVGTGDIRLGSFIQNGSRTFYPLGPVLNSDEGKIVFGAYSVGTGSGLSGSGTLAKITCTASLRGTCPLQLSDVKLSDSQAGLIPVQVEDNAIEVTGSFWADVNRDNILNVVDIQQVASHWNTQKSSGGYDPIYDLDKGGAGDGDIDIVDLELSASWWNAPIPEQNLLYVPDAPAAPPSIHLTMVRTLSNRLDINVDRAAELGGFDLDFFAAGPMTITSVLPGNLLTGSGNTAVVLGPAYTNDKKEVTLGVYSYGSNRGVSGSGTLATIVFSGLKPNFTIRSFNCADLYGRPVAVDSLKTGVDETAIPVADFGLLQNYPNPFNPNTTIQFSIDKKSQVSLMVYSIAGQKIRVLYRGIEEPGQYSVEWDGKDDSKKPVASGVYLCVLKANERTLTKKMIFIQ